MLEHSAIRLNFVNGEGVEQPGVFFSMVEDLSVEPAIAISEAQGERDSSEEKETTSENNQDTKTIADVPDDPFFQNSPQLWQFQSDMERLWSNRFRNKQHCDLRIELDGSTQYAHRCILGSQSSFFACLVKSDMKDKTNVSLKGLFKFSESFKPCSDSCTLALWTTILWKWHLIFSNP